MSKQDGSEPPRVWTLIVSVIVPPANEAGERKIPVTLIEANGPAIAPNESPTVIEAEPFAELLEELIDAARYAPDYFIEKWGIDKTVETAAALVATLRAGDPTDGENLER